MRGAGVKPDEDGPASGEAPTCGMFAAAPAARAVSSATKAALASATGSTAGSPSKNFVIAIYDEHESATEKRCDVHCAIESHTSMFHCERCNIGTAADVSWFVTDVY